MYDLDLVEVLCFKTNTSVKVREQNKEQRGMYDIDLVEVLFKDQFFSRSDISRMRNSLVCMTLTLWRCYLKTNTSVGVI